MTQENRLFLGNPGTGKSTLINCLIGEPKLKSGLSYGGGHTQDYHRNGVAYMDTPGLADRSIADKAAQAITMALKQGGRYKLFFMLRLQNGRVVCEDMATLERVLDAIAVDAIALVFSIIFNNVNKKQYAVLMQPASDAYEYVKRQINSRRYKTNRICFVPAISQLYEQEDTVAQLPSHVRSFVEAAPAMWIDPRSVRTIDVIDFAEHAARIQEEMHNALKERDAVLALMATDHQRFEEEMASTRTAHKAQTDRLRYRALDVPSHMPLSPTADYERTPPSGGYEQPTKRWSLTKKQMLIGGIACVFLALVIVIIVLATRGHGDCGDETRATKKGCTTANGVSAESWKALDTGMSVNDLAVAATFESKPYFIVWSSQPSNNITNVALSKTLPPLASCTSNPRESTLSVYAVTSLLTKDAQSSSTPTMEVRDDGTSMPPATIARPSMTPPPTPPLTTTLPTNPTPPNNTTPAPTTRAPTGQ